MLDRQPEKEKENFNTSFTELTKNIPRMWKHLVLTTVEESRPALLESELITITAASAMNEFSKM